MAEADVKDGNPRRHCLASGLIKDQKAQIATMQDLLATL